MCVLFAIGFWAQSLQFYIFWNLVNKNRNYLSRVVKKKKKKKLHYSILSLPAQRDK